MAQRHSKTVGSSSAPPLAGRLRKLRASVAALECDALLVTDPNDIRYLTGFSGEDSYALVTPRSLVILSDFRFEEELAPLKRRCTLVMRDGPIVPAAGALITDQKLKHVAIQSGHISVATRRAIAREVGAKKLKDTTDLIAELRIVKDASEIRAIRRAIRIQERALEATLEQIAPGWSEREIAALLEFEMKAGGADEPSFPTIVAARANGSKPHYRPGAWRTSPRKSLLIDWGARASGYCSDMTRTFSFGSWSRTMREIYEIVLEAHEAALAAVRPGLACQGLDQVARRIIDKAGYAKAFGHGLGHGIGLDIHEAPRLAPRIARPLEPGMVITIEPGIYLPGVGGVRIEDDILVTARGGKSLCSLPKDLAWATR